MPSTCYSSDFTNEASQQTLLATRKMIENLLLHILFCAVTKWQAYNRQSTHMGKTRQVMLLSSLISSKMCKKKYFNIEGLSLMTMQVVFSTMLGQNLNSWLITKPFLFGKMTTYVDTCFMWSARRQAEVRLWQILLNWACWGWETSKHAGHEPLRSRTEGHC